MTVDCVTGLGLFCCVTLESFSAFSSQVSNWNRGPGSRAQGGTGLCTYSCPRKQRERDGLTLLPPLTMPRSIQETVLHTAGLSPNPNQCSEDMSVGDCLD